MEDNELGLGVIFTQPPSPPPPEPTYSPYTRFSPSVGSLHNHDKSADIRQLSIRLVGWHPLWGHHLWNAARCFATYLDCNAGDLCVGRRVLELGAGGGLPGIIAALCGAQRVLLTDYPDEELVENIRINVENNVPAELRGVVQIQGYIWGRSVTELVAGSGHSPEGFDLILMSDLIFNHSQHDALLHTAGCCLSSASAPEQADPPHSSSLSSPLLATPPKATPKTPCILVFYTHHRPHLAERDLAFFSKARERGWMCEKIVTERFQPMFPEDSGDESVRSVVHGWRLTRRVEPSEINR